MHIFRNTRQIIYGVLFRSGCENAKKLWPAIVRHRPDIQRMYMSKHRDYKSVLLEHLSNERTRMRNKARRQLTKMTG